jgi:hypothetical protein
MRPQADGTALFLATRVGILTSGPGAVAAQRPGRLACPGALGAAGGLGPARAWASAPSGAPVPIPNGITVDGKLFHLFLPASSALAEESSIFNMNAFLGVAAINGQGTGRSAAGSAPLFFGADMRFMDGEFVDAQGAFRRATFGFV